MNREKAREILKIEAAAVLSLSERIGPEFDAAVETITACKGHLVVTGMGKAGLVGQKISNSGETEEVGRLLPSIKQIGAKIVAITATKGSTLGRNADIVVELGRIEEACPLKLAPSATTTAILALGDALALCVMEARGFDKEQFSFYHPGGDLGRKLLKVSDVMRTGDRNPIVKKDTMLTEAIATITKARAGAVTIIDAAGKLCGIFTDGDLRRKMSQDPNLLQSKIGAVMTANPGPSLPTVSPARRSRSFMRRRS